VKMDYFAVGVCGQCFVALVFLEVGSLVLLAVFKAVQIFSPTTPAPFRAIEQLVNVQKLEEARSAIALAPFLMTVLLVTEFYHMTGPAPSETEYVCVVACTVGLCVQVAIVLLKGLLASSEGSMIFATVLKALVLLPTYAAFFVLLYVVFDNNVNSDFPLTVTFSILIVVAVLKLVIVFIEDAASRLVELLDEKRLESLLRHIESIKAIAFNLVNTTGLAEIVCVLLVFIHFRAQVLLQESTSVYLDGFGWLYPAIILAVSCMALQMVGVLAAALAPESAALRYLFSIPVSLSYVALAMIVVAVASNPPS